MTGPAMRSSTRSTGSRSAPTTSSGSPASAPRASRSRRTAPSGRATSPSGARCATRWRARGCTSAGWRRQRRRAVPWSAPTWPRARPRWPAPVAARPPAQWAKAATAWEAVAWPVPDCPGALARGRGVGRGRRSPAAATAARAAKQIAGELGSRWLSEEITALAERAPARSGWRAHPPTRPTAPSPTAIRSG